MNLNNVAYYMKSKNSSLNRILYKLKVIFFTKMFFLIWKKKHRIDASIFIYFLHVPQFISIFFNTN